MINSTSGPGLLFPKVQITNNSILVIGHFVFDFMFWNCVLLLGWMGKR